MKKILLLVLSLCLVAALLIFCGAVERDKNIFGSTDEKENTIYIGVIEPLTGDDAPGAMREVLGFRYANAVCPTVDISGVTYNVKLLEADSMSSENGSENAAKSLIYSNVAAVLGAYDSENASYCLPLFEKEKIPVIGVSCSSPKIDTDNFFRMCFTDTFQCGAAANLAYSMDCRKAAVLTQTADVYSKAAGKMFADEFSRLGGEVVNLSFQSGQENFKALAEEIKDSKADIVFMMSGPYEAKYFINQSRKYGLNCPVIGPENWDSGLILSSISSYPGNVFFLSEFGGESKSDPVGAEFAKRFSSWISKDEERVEANGGCDYASSSSALAYDAYMLILEAIKSSSSSEPKAIMESLRNISYNGVTGSISFDKNGESGKKLAFIKKAEPNQKQFEILKTISSGK